MSSPADWYPQPDGQLRYWDGQAWTEHFAPGSGQGSEVAATVSSVANSTAESMRCDIAAAKSKMARNYGVGRAVKRLESYVDDDEHVDAMVSGKYNDSRGLLVLTDRRMLFIVEGLLSNLTEDFALRNITSVAWSSGALGGSIAICSGGYTYIEKVDKSNGVELVGMARSRLANPRPTVAAPAPAAGSDLIEQLKQMGELRDAGIVTDAEFAARKTQILAQM